MTKINQAKVLESTKILYAQSGYEPFSIRSVAKSIPISHSVLYHYFSSEQELLKSMFDYTNTQLGVKRKALPKVTSAKEMLRQRIEFQIDNTEDIVAVLKYYLAHRNDFKKFENGFVPDKSTLHIVEVLDFGLKTGEFYVLDLKDDAKVITHAINGFLLEYYPHKPMGREKQELIDRIYNFLIRALKGGEK